MAVVTVASLVEEASAVKNLPVVFLLIQASKELQPVAVAVVVE